jgi:hypothetical protein
MKAKETTVSKCRLVLALRLSARSFVYFFSHILLKGVEIGILT